MKKWIVPAGVLALLCFFLFREYQVARITSPRIFVESELILFRTPSEYIFGMGRIESPRAKSIIRGMLPFFSQTEVRDIWSIPEGEALMGPDFVIQRVSPNLVRLKCSEQVSWWIGNDFSEKEKAIAVAAGVPFSSDWWMMTKNRLPEFFSLPSQGILYGGDRSPSPKTIAFAKEKEIPLISIKETEGFMLSYILDSWELKTRD